MSSLSVHLRLPEDHSGLPFHPSCPVCRRDRLAGSLEGDEIVSRRTQAALAVGVLAFSGVGAPAGAVAAGSDQDVDGSAEVVESPDPGADFDETTTRWTDGGVAPPEDEAPALVPETDDGSMEAAAREPAEEPLIAAAGETEEPAAVADPAAEPVALAAPPTEDPIATTETALSDGIRVDTAKRAKRELTVKRTKPTAQPRVIAAPAPVVAPAPSNAATIRVVAGANENTITRATSGARFHVVERGESLWSIATDRLGERAGVARIASEVHRLWQLNEDRIASGSPDLLYAGTRLRLR